VKDKEKKKEDTNHNHDISKRAMPKSKKYDETDQLIQEENNDKNIDKSKNRDVFLVKSKTFLSKQNPFGIEL